MNVTDTHIMIHDAHCHFFSTRFFEALARDKTNLEPEAPANSIPALLGWEPPGTPTELVNLHISAIVESTKPAVAEIPSGSGDGSTALKMNRKVYFKETEGEVDCSVCDREKLGAGDEFIGPAIIEEWNSTTVVHPGQHLGVDAYGNLIISLESVS